MITLEKLHCLHMREPMGIDATPYFSWVIKSDCKDVVQANYRLVVRDDAGHTVWDTGEVESDQSTFVNYTGQTLKSRTRYIWDVTVRDNYGNSASAESAFETALLQKADWRANWVASPLPTFERQAHFGEQPPAALFRQAFRLEKDIASARLYATCHGIYRLTVNGQRADNREFAPEFTVYRDYLCYQTYDLTALLHRGENVLGLHVGDGWYHSFMTKPDMDDYDPALAVLAQLEVTYADGSTATIVSDGTMQVAESPVRHSDLFAGECYDASFAKPGWDTPEYNAEEWQSGVLKDYGYHNLKAQYGQPVRPVMTLPVAEAIVSPKGELLLDFGQVIAGRVRLRVKIPKGQSVTIEHTEALTAEGNYFDNHPSADQRIVFVSNGSEMVYEPIFTFQGFRYLYVTGLHAINPEDFSAVALSSEKDDIGTFACSNPDVTRLYQNTRWSQSGNMLSIPTDCPQREKAGWGGDLQVYTTTALLNEDITPFLTRWLQNLACDQRDNGSVPFVVPLAGAYIGLYHQYGEQFGTPNEVAPAGWGDAAVLVPYYMYQVTGNTRILQNQYESMKKWCDFVLHTARTRRPPESTLPDKIEQYLWNTGHHYGEHLIPSYSKDGYGESTFEAIRLTIPYVAPIYAYYSVSLFADTARLLGNTKDAAHYADMAGKIKDAFQKGVIQENGDMPVELMGAYAMPIYFDLVPEKFKQHFADKLVELLDKNGGCLDTGFLGTPILQDALCKIGREDLAYNLLFQDKAPSWLYEVKHGATTIWESWYAMDEDGAPFCTQLGEWMVTMSLNHYAFGCVDDWMFRHISGIDHAEPGFKRIKIQPHLDKRLQWAKRSYASEYGDIKTDWHIEGDAFKMDVEIPCNTTAEIVLPDASRHTVGSGRYSYSCKAFSCKTS